MPRQLSNVESLYLQYDKTPPADEMQAAQERDGRGEPSGVFFADAPPPPPRFKSGAELVEKMARVMIDRSTATGACTDSDLIAAGFLPDEIDTYRSKAAALAAHLTADSVREKIKAARTRRKRA